MAVTPPPTRLLVSISTEAGALSNSIAVLDPEGGQIERHLATEPDPRRLILTESGSQLYVVHGTNRVSCLALPDGRPEFNFLIPDGEAILEILPETGKGGGLIIGTTQSIAIYDRGAPRTKRVNAQASQRTLRAVGGAYWCAEPGRLRSFRVTAQGIEPDILSIPTIDPDLKDFTSDGQRLYFRNQSFSLTSKTRPARSIL